MPFPILVIHFVACHVESTIQCLVYNAFAVCICSQSTLVQKSCFLVDCFCYKIMKKKESNIFCKMFGLHIGKRYCAWTLQWLSKCSFKTKLILERYLNWANFDHVLLYVHVGLNHFWTESCTSGNQQSNLKLYFLSNLSLTLDYPCAYNLLVSIVNNNVVGGELTMYNMYMGPRGKWAEEFEVYTCLLDHASLTSAGASNEYNIHKRFMKNMTIFKLEPAAPNRLQLITTCHNRVATWVQHVAPNAICSAEILQSFGRGFNSVPSDLNSA